MKILHCSTNESHHMAKRKIRNGLIISNEVGFRNSTPIHEFQNKYFLSTDISQLENLIY